MRAKAPAALALAGTLAACAQPEWFCVRPSGVRSLEVRSDVAAARGGAIAVALVSVTETSLAQQLAQVPAAAFFARRAQLERDNPGTLQTISVELAPGQSVGPLAVDTPCTPEATFVFAFYRSDGEHRARLDGASAVAVVLGDRGFEVVTP